MAEYKKEDVHNMFRGFEEKDPGSDVAFNAMENATKSKASNLFRESEYNAIATDKDRAGYDQKAFSILREMYDVDSTKNKFKDIDFNRYLELLKPSLFEERVLSREGDQKMGDFFLDIYEGDFDQFRTSAKLAYDKSEERLMDLSDPGWKDRVRKPGWKQRTRESGVFNLRKPTGDSGKY